MARTATSLLIGVVAAGTVVALGVPALGADPNDFLSMYVPFSGQSIGVDGRLVPITRSSMDLFQQYNTSVSQSASSSFTSGALSIKTDTDFRDTAKMEGTAYVGSFIGNSSRWQENQVGYTNSQMALGDTIRVKTRFGASTYDASADFFNSLGKQTSPEAQRALRFASHFGPASGAAALTRAEEDIVKRGDVSVTLFQQFSQVNSFFEDIKFSDKSLRKQTKDDVFSTPDRATNTYGISLAKGSSGLMFSQSSISDLNATPSSYYREQRFNSRAWWGLRDLVSGFSNSSDSLVGNIIPTNVWVGYSEGAARQNIGATTLIGPATTAAAFPFTVNAWGDTTGSTIRNLDAGLFWQWGSTSATVSAWRSQQVGDLSTLSLSDGADVNFSVLQKNWGVSVYMSLSRSSTQDGANYSGSRSLDGGTTFSVFFADWPNLTLSFDVSNYDGVYTGWDGKETSRTASAGIGLDFSKYLNERSRQKLNLFYYARDNQYTSQWGAFNSSSSTIEHVFGTRFRTPL